MRALLGLSGAWLEMYYLRTNKRGRLALEPKRESAWHGPSPRIFFNPPSLVANPSLPTACRVEAVSTPLVDFALSSSTDIMREGDSIDIMVHLHRVLLLLRLYLHVARPLVPGTLYNYVSN